MSFALLLKSSALIAYNLEEFPCDLEDLREGHAGIQKLKKRFESIKSSSEANSGEKKRRKVAFKLEKAKVHHQDAETLLNENKISRMDAYLDWIIKFYEARLAKAEKKTPDANWSEKKIAAKQEKLQNVLAEMRKAKEGTLDQKRSYFEGRKEATQKRITSKSKAQNKLNSEKVE